jgi:hypothetical protein
LRDALRAEHSAVKTEDTVDFDAFERGAFKAQEGFTRINKAFDGKLEESL